MSSIEEQRAQHMALAMQMAPEMMARLDWDAERLHAHRTEALRMLVRIAVDRSPWHRKRLAEVCPERLEVGDLPALPVMTKADVMANFDEVVTDDRLTLAAVEEYLTEAATRGYLLDEYTPAATGGSTGRRGVSVYDRHGFAAGFLAGWRWLLRDLEGDEELRGIPTLTTAHVHGSHPSHIGSAVARIFRNPARPSFSVPVTRPVEEIVATLNALQPDLIFAYPSMLHVLTVEAAAGRLGIAPRRFISVGEALLPEVRAAIAATWATPVLNLWAATEAGSLGSTCEQGRVHLCDDTVIVEPVDATNRPVPPGTVAAKLLVTNLVNPVQPTIRYEITDEVTVLPDPCPCGVATACVADVQGRQDDAFTYGDRWVHPHVFRTALGRRPGIVEYQVRQTAAGADISIHCRDRVDLDGLAREIEAGLGTLGVADAAVTVAPVDRVGRLPATGKLRRFVPLAAQG